MGITNAQAALLPGSTTKTTQTFYLGVPIAATVFCNGISLVIFDIVQLASITVMSELNKQLCSLAENYIENSYYRVGDHSYAWTEENDYSSDDMSVVTGECPPSDADSYSCWEVVSCEIESSEVDDRNDETGEYSVTVKAWVAVSSGDEDEEVDKSVAPDLRTIYVQLDRDEEGDFCVVGTEE
ncbi:hypothetical protein [Nostoc sp.]|uniref:hypothetical protein n=1 Tax=Nostoc sp. TaxID=1180 RepID=UPI002FFA349E